MIEHELTERELIEHEFFSNSICREQTRLAERELFAHIGAVTELFGPEQARSSAEDWLEEAELLEVPRFTGREWRAITVAASVRLASRLNAAQRQSIPVVASTDTKVSPIPSSNCFASTASGVISFVASDAAGRARRKVSQEVAELIRHAAAKAR
jgi:hypothetical protein